MYVGMACAGGNLLADGPVTAHTWPGQHVVAPRRISSGGVQTREGVPGSMPRAVERIHNRPPGACGKRSVRRRSLRSAFRSRIPSVLVCTVPFVGLHTISPAAHSRIHAERTTATATRYQCSSKYVCTEHRDEPLCRSVCHGQCLSPIVSERYRPCMENRIRMTATVTPSDCDH